MRRPGGEVTLTCPGQRVPFREGPAFELRRARLYRIALDELKQADTADISRLRLASHRIGRILVWKVPEELADLPRGYQAVKIRDERTLSLDGMLFTTLGPLHLLADRPQFHRLCADLLDGFRQEIEALTIIGREERPGGKSWEVSA